MYGVARSIESCPAGDSLPELIIDGCDDEQVWQELELLSEPVLADCLQSVSKLSVNKGLLNGASPNAKESQKLKAATVVSSKKDSKAARVEVEEDNFDNDGSDDDIENDDENDITSDNADDDIGDAVDESEANKSDAEEEAELERLLDAAAEKKDIDVDESEDEDDGGIFNGSDREMSDSNDENIADDMDIGESESQSKRKQKKARDFDNTSGNRREGEDRFFNLEAMNDFLDKEESGQLDLLDDEDIDVFADIGDDDTQVC